MSLNQMVKKHYKENLVVKVRNAAIVNDSKSRLAVISPISTSQTPPQQWAQYPNDFQRLVSGRVFTYGPGTRIRKLESGSARTILYIPLDSNSTSGNGEQEEVNSSFYDKGNFEITLRAPEEAQCRKDKLSMLEEVLGKRNVREVKK